MLYLRAFHPRFQSFLRLLPLPEEGLMIPQPCTPLAFSVQACGVATATIDAGDTRATC